MSKTCIWLDDFHLDLTEEELSDQDTIALIKHDVRVIEELFRIYNIQTIEQEFDRLRLTARLTTLPGEHLLKHVLAGLFRFKLVVSVSVVLLLEENEGEAKRYTVSTAVLYTDVKNLK